MVISNHGEVYLLGKKLNKRKRKLPDFDFVVFKIDKESLEESPVFINETRLPTVAKITLVESKSTSFVVAGLYNNAKIKGIVEGVYYCKGPMDGKEQYTEVESLFKFGEDLNKSAEKSVITNILNFPNGDIAIVSEQRYADEIERLSIDGDSADPYTNYISNDVLVTRFNPKGKVKNVAIIKKQFYTKNQDYYYSNHSGAIGNKCVIAFNQFYEDGEIENVGRSFFALGMSTIAPQARIVILGENGEKSADGILKLGSEKLFFAPPLTSISDDLFLLGSIDNKFITHSFGELKID